MVAPATFEEPRVRRPVFSPAAEEAVLGGCIIDREALDRASMILPDPAMFHREKHRRFYAALLRVHQRGEVIDEVTLRDELTKSGDLESTGGLAFMGELLDATPTAENIEYHARIVRDDYILRQIAAAGHAIGEIGATPTRDIAAAIDEAEAALAAVTQQQRTAERPTWIKEALWPVFERAEAIAAAGTGVSGLPSGFDEVDAITGGAQNGELILVAARPSMGKTSWLYGQILHVAVKTQKPGLLFSPELSTHSAVQQMLCMEAAVDSTRMRRGKLEDDDYARLAIAAGRLDTAPIYIDDTPGISITAARSKARQMKRDVPDLAWIGVDYLQLMEGAGTKRKGGSTRQEDVSEISRGLKNLARELNIPVIALSQLSRAVESRPDKRPMLSDLRESGSLEQDADVIMFLYRPEYYFGPVDKEGNSLVGRAELIIGKQRHGAAGRDTTVPLHFHKEITTFEPWATQ